MGVLIVDNNRDAADSLHELLSALGYASRTAYSGSEALAAVREAAPAAIICDLMMPDLDGVALCRMLRQLPELEDTTFIAWSGLSDGAAQRSAVAAGFHHYVVKSGDLEEILMILRNAVPHAANVSMHTTPLTS